MNYFYFLSKVFPVIISFFSRLTSLTMLRRESKANTEGFCTKNNQPANEMIDMTCANEEKSHSRVAHEKAGSRCSVG